MKVTEILTDVEYNSEEQTIETKIGEVICTLSPEVQLWYEEVGHFIAEAIKEKVEREKDDGWVAIEDKTPPDLERVLWIDRRDGKVNISSFVWSQTPIDYVSHWRPLPEPPKTTRP